MDATTREEREPKPGDPRSIFSNTDLARELRRLLRDTERRWGRGIARAGLAKRIGVSASSLYAYLNGTTLIPADALFHLLRELGVDEQHAHEVRRARDDLTEPVAAVPQGLPMDVDSFTGRATHLAELDRLRRKSRKASAVVVSAVSGIGGIGKTALAIRWAHLRRRRFPDGCLYLDLRGFHPDKPLQPDEALAALLRRLGVSGPGIPVDPDERMQRYQILLNGKRMLILLDNAFSADQVRPLLPPGTSSCFVLVTSRDRLTGLVVAQGANPLIVDTLPESEARALLATRLGRQRLETEPDAVAELLTYCAGLPLALRIVSGHAQVNPQLSLAALATELRDDDTRLGALDNADPAASLPAVLSWSYNALPIEQTRVFTLLGIATGPDISLAAAANLTNLPTSEANVILQALERASLVHQHKPGRYQMHDLIRLYAAHISRSLPAATQTAALRRLVDFFLHTAHTGDRLLSPHRVPVKIGPPVTSCFHHPLADAAMALQWFDAEHRCLLAAHHIAVAHGWHTAVWQLAWALNTFHWRRGHLHDHVASWRAALAAAERLGESTIRAQAHRRLGRAYARAGRHAEALDHLRQALTLAEQADDTADQAHIHIALAWACERQGDNRRALNHSTHGLRLFQSVNNPAREADAFNAVGWFHARLGNHDQGRHACERALTLARQNHHRECEADALDSLGYIAYHTDHHTEALDYYNQALTLYHDNGDTYQEANTLARLGEAHAGLGQHIQARDTLRQALDLYRAQHHTAAANRIQHQLDALS